MAEKKKHVGLEGAPYWYNTHFNDLDFEWSKEEALELERYAEKYVKNAAEEDMTPLDRTKAHWSGCSADRKIVGLSTMVVYATRTLDSYADALKPVDCYKHPKLMVKAKIAATARFKCDFINWAMITYSEGLWGGHSKMIDYGNPSMVGEPPIKTMKDLEATEDPDPYIDGLYPGYLWANREIRRFYDKYKLPFAHWTSMCPGAVEIMQLGMMGWNPALKAIARDPDFAKAAAAKADKFNRKIAHALIDVSRPEGIYCCQFTGGFPIRGGAEWVADVWRELGLDIKAYSLKQHKQYVHLSHGYSYLSGAVEWYEVMTEHGSFGKQLWDGGTSPAGEKGVEGMEKIMDWHRDHDVYIGCGPSDKICERGPLSKIEEELTRWCKRYDHRRHAVWQGLGYFAPPAHVDFSMATMKKLCKL